VSARRLASLAVVIVVATHATHARGEDFDAPDPGREPATTTWNAYVTPYFSLMVGGGSLLDYNGFDQGDESAQQMDIFDTGGIRDIRLLVAGYIFSKDVIYTFGYAYDPVGDQWLVRQTGLNVHARSLSGHMFIGRQKEGFSTSKMTVGYWGYFVERSAANDAFLPILADGVRWVAAPFDHHLVYNVGAFTDMFSEHENFNKNSWQAVGRAVWLPYEEGAGTVLHLATELRYAGAVEGELQYKSKPEAFLAQSSAVDTGKFDASRSTMVGFEAYLLRGPWSFGSEYFLNFVSSMPADNPFFHGGDVFAAYMLTGEMRPYDVRNAVFNDVLPAHPFASGGPGAWEIAVRGSYVDLDSGPIDGGRFFRVTPQVNWYVSETLRFEAAYGYGILDRMEMTGHTHFFQLRMQLTIPSK
jgi:phosphate-selective porin OprO/OprP